MDKNELKQRLRDHEDGWVERKTKNIKSEEICEALVGFANSLPEKEKGILFIGVSDTGTPLGVDNTDKMQKNIERWANWCYPPVAYQTQVVEDPTGVYIVAVIVEASSKRPHFAGPAFIRVGSQFQKASERKFEELIDRRHSVVNAILTEKDLDHEVYIEDKRYSGAPRSLCKVKDCDAHVVTFEVIRPPEGERSASVSKIHLSKNQGLTMFTINP